MNNLEHISYEEVRHSRLGTYADWRKSLKPDYLVVWRDIFLGYAALVLLLAASVLIHPGHPALVAVSVLSAAILLGLTLAYLALFLHEAGHFNLHPDKKKNDRLAKIFLGILFGLDIRSYRKIHWQHHLHLGTPSDSETSYFNALTAGFLVESFTGIHLIKVISKKSRNGFLSPEMKKESRLLLVLGGLFHLLLLVALLWMGEWTTAIAWVLAMVVFFPFFATLRQILEHRDELAERGTDFSLKEHGKFSRLFGSSFFSKVFGGAGFNKHMIHHWDPKISYTCMRDIENFLSECETTKELVARSKTSYWKTARKLLSR